MMNLLMTNKIPETTHRKLTKDNYIKEITMYFKHGNTDQVDIYYRKQRLIMWNEHITNF